MKETQSGNEFCVFDDVLSENDQYSAWEYILNENFSNSIGWQRIIRITDDLIFGSPNYIWCLSDMPATLKPVGQAIYNVAKSKPEICGKEGVDWSALSLRTLMYKAGQRRSWHLDGNSKATIAYYAHLEWRSCWGGGLLLADIPSDKHPDQAVMESRARDALVDELGIGQYITPKPNRISVVGSGRWHMVDRIDADAGDNTRCVIVGQLVPKQ